MVDAVAAPRPTAQAEGLPHPVPQIATVGGCLRLVHQDSAGFGRVRQGHDLVGAGAGGGFGLKDTNNDNNAYRK